MLRGQDLLMDVLQRIGLRYKTSLGLRSGFQSQVPFKFSKDSGDRVSNPKFKKGKGINSPTEKPTCGKRGKKHNGYCLKGQTIVLVVVKVGTRFGIDLM